MATLLKALGAIGKGVARTVKRVVMGILRAFGQSSGLGKSLAGRILFDFFLLFLFFSAVFTALDDFLPAETTYEAVEDYATEQTMSQEEIRNIFMDAESFLAFLKAHPDFDYDEYNSYNIDKKTLYRILEAVAAYNGECRKKVLVNYEYKVFEGKVTGIDEITGAVTMEPYTVVTKEEQTKTVYEKVPFSEEELAKVSDPVTREHMRLYGYKMVPKTTVTQKEVSENVEPKESSKWESVELCRQNIDSDPAHFGENVFYMHWQPVFALACMFINDNYENYGSYEESDDFGVSYYLSDQDLQDIIDIFSYEYSFYDDLAAENRVSVSFDRIFTESSVYRLYTEPSVEEIKVGIQQAAAEGTDYITTITVKRIPSMAPREIKNSYLSYLYNYQEEPATKYYQMVSRTCTFEPERFIERCKLVDPDFDLELFTSVLEVLPDTEEQVIYYDGFLDCERKVETSKDASVSSAIGSMVSKVSDGGWFRKVFNRNGIIYNIEDSQYKDSSAIIPGMDYMYGDGMETNDFLLMKGYAEQCLGTPYLMGSNGGPGISFDCSSFVSWVLRQCGYPVGRETTSTLIRYCDYVDSASARPGDIIFFQNTYRSGVSHVGIWLGNGQFIHASSSKGVTVTDYTTSSYFKKHFLSFGRLPQK